MHLSLTGVERRVWKEGGREGGREVGREER